jgi:hypothetical protein
MKPPVNFALMSPWTWSSYVQEERNLRAQGRPRPTSSSPSMCYQICDMFYSNDPQRAQACYEQCNRSEI